MNVLARPPGTSARSVLRALLYGVPVVALLGLLGVFLVGRPTALDENLCPVDSPPARRTILLLDTSDPLTPKHVAELRRLVSELQQPGASPGAEDFYVAPGEALIVYELAIDLRNLKPAMEVCNPGDRPDDWDWKKDLTRGKAFALHNWRRFEEKSEELFPDEESSQEMPRSPILENIGVIVPRYAPSKRKLPAGKESHTHLIVFSDLLQHSDNLSHYGPYPEAGDFLDTPRLRELATDLARVDVSLFRLERSKYSRWQTTDHYYWWTGLVREFNGAVLWQESL